jgi:hypothetical protein
MHGQILIEKFFYWTKLLPEQRSKQMPKRIDPSELPPVIGTLYPTPFDQTSRARERTKLGDQAGLTQFHRPKRQIQTDSSVSPSPTILDCPY